MSGMRSYLGVCVLALAASFGLGVPALAQDNSDLAVGQDAWNRAGCTSCHGNMAQGGPGGDSPVGPSLRSVGYDKETMAMIVSCGLPGTEMPSFLQGAYTEVDCYGMPVGERPAGMTLSGLFTADEITALVDYVFATFVQTPQP